MYLFELFVFGTTRNLKSHRPDIIFSQSSGFVNSEIWGFCLNDSAFWVRTDEKIPARAAYGCGGRLQRRGKSMRSGAPPDGHRSDSSGMLYAFPIQRSSDSGRVALRLSRPPGLRNAKIFSALCKCPRSACATRSGIFSVSWYREVWIFGVYLI